MNPIKITIRALRDAATEASDEERELVISLAIARREVTRIETLLVGAREKYRLAKEILHKTTSSIPHNECSHREVELLRKRGIIVQQGDELTEFLKAELCKMGMTDFSCLQE